MVKYRISLTNSGRSAKKMSQLDKNWSASRCSNPKGGCKSNGSQSSRRKNGTSRGTFRGSPLSQITEMKLRNIPYSFSFFPFSRRVKRLCKSKRSPFTVGMLI